MQKYEYKVIKVTESQHDTEQEFSDLINAGTTGGWELKTIEAVKKDFYLIYQKLIQRVI